MNRETKRVKLSNCEAEIITYLTWGEKEAIQSTILKGAKMNDQGQTNFDPTSFLATKRKALEVAVKKFHYQDGREEVFTMEAMENLSVEDGDTLYAEVDEVTKPKKKEVVNN
jgi:hypothetical protein